MPPGELEVATPNPRTGTSESRSVFVRRGETTFVELIVPATARLVGRLTQEGDPLPGALVTPVHVGDLPSGATVSRLREATRASAWFTQSMTDVEGSFAFNELDLGDQVLVITHEAHALAEYVAARVTRDAPPIEIDLACASIEGRVRWARGEAPAGARVWLLPADGIEEGLRSIHARPRMSVDQGREADCAWTGSDDSGAFRFDCAPADLPLVVAVVEAGYRSAISAPFTLAANALHGELDLELVPGGRVLVTLELPSDKRDYARFYSPLLLREDSERRGVRLPTGEFVFESLEAGLWSLSIRKPFDESVELVAPIGVEVTAGETTELSVDLH
jgi:hypothetical protein